MYRFRTFRNDDPPRLADLWNRGLPDRDVSKPLSPHEFDLLVSCKPGFDAKGFIVAEDSARRLVGFAHAGFGPVDPSGASHALDSQLGTVAMLVVDPDRNDPGLELDLLREAERYLVGRGARVIYAGGRYPVTPFYWGIYGGSEFSGVLPSHAAFTRAAQSGGYDVAASAVAMELDLTDVKPRDPKAVPLRRQTSIEIIEDVKLDSWWKASAVGIFRPTRYRLLSLAAREELARVTTWEMTGFCRIDGRPRLGIIDLEVPPRHRRQGYARHLLCELSRRALDQWIEILVVQTDATNVPALTLYDSVGFVQTGTTTLYRRPG